MKVKLMKIIKNMDLEYVQPHFMLERVHGEMENLLDGEGNLVEIKMF